MLKVCINPCRTPNVAHTIPLTIHMQAIWVGKPVWILPEQHHGQVLQPYSPEGVRLFHQKCKVRIGESAHIVAPAYVSASGIKLLITVLI